MQSISTINSLKKVYPELPSWAALVVASAIFFGLTLGTQLEPLAIGLLTSSVALLVLMTLFECAWKVLRRVLKGFGVDIDA